ncbi:MAG: MgtC/SapB family protein [Acutalibacter sp.]|nr:MgtC/SapB family protein [Acutalibacter sp.]
MPYTDPIVTLLGPWSAQLTFETILLRMGVSLVLSAIIGCERSSKRHSAGLRTFILVSLACTTAMLVDTYLCTTMGSNLFLISAAAVVSLSVISVNSTLFSSRSQIKGLTTSVGLWFCGIIGLALGGGYYTVTLVGFVVLMCGLALFPSLELYLKNRSNHFEVHLELKNRQYLQDFVTTIRRLGLIIDDIELNPAYIHSGLSVYSIAISISSQELRKYKTHSQIIEALATLDYVYHIEEMKG